MPESPRQLVHKGRHEVGFEVVALAYADSGQQNPVVLAQYKEIIDILKYEVKNGETLNMM